MSKKTDAEKRARRAVIARVHKRNLRRRRLNPIPAEWRQSVDGASGPALPPAIASTLMDLALGQGFVQFLRTIGVRDKIVEVVFTSDEAEMPEGSD